LVQQAISEAKVAVTLSPQNIAAWENLGATYQAIMPVAQGSDTWAAASYQKALAIDPTNPLLWVNLGSVLVHQKKYDDAIVAFDRATSLRSDYANAYYNLANAYKLKGDAISATGALTKAMELVAPGSSDYAKVKNELDGVPSATVSGTSQLTLPQ
jgi:predicted Zn-dependent protease